VIAALLLAQALPPAAPATASPAIVQPEQARFAKAREVIELIIPPAQREAMFAQVVEGFMANMIGGMLQGNEDLRAAFDEEPRLKPVFASFVERQRKLAMDDLRTTMPELTTAYVNAYARMFSVDELEAMRQFFATPTGAKYVRLSPGLVSDPDFAAWQRHVGQLAERRKADELKTLMDDVMPIVRARTEKQTHGS
jgi:hypothetical protein